MPITFERGNYQGWYLLYGDSRSETFKYAVGPVKKKVAKNLSRVFAKYMNEMDCLPVRGVRVLEELAHIENRYRDQADFVYKPPDVNNRGGIYNGV